MDPSSTEPTDYTELANQLSAGLERTLGLVFTRATVDEVCAIVPVGPHLHQPYGIVHGGVHASIVEALCSTGAGIRATLEGKASVGVENSTSFLRAVREGVLHARATPLHIGVSSQVWSAEIRDDRDRLVATGRVRLLVVEGGQLKLQPTDPG